ncbi:PREDICTED: uncharacterized protein LOC106821610 [Priapulus caudatus]|uniref:Uncharacterized protein LOC106821610 n=1 Tax=Priapulus caudatus TaxID=37621 RepID=A0ABM1FC08_PRICU|nr:PREDICTED: uncharacterized protein LOC106821610 [Priapulus caudatus]
MQRAPQLQQDNIDRRGEVGKQNSEHAKQGGGGNAAPQPIGRALFDTADGIFDLEGLEEDMVLDHRAFYESEDDLETPETTDDSSNSSSVTEHDHSSAAVNMYGGRPSQSSYQVAQSLPINMPLETQHHQHTAAPTGGDRAVSHSGVPSIER